MDKIALLNHIRLNGIEGVDGIIDMIIDTIDDGDKEVLKLLSSTSAEISQGEVLQLQHKGEVDMLEETYLKIISAKTAS